jgi:hypothetical protein
LASSSTARRLYPGPARFAFAHGGKDGTPYPIDREACDRTIEVMNAALSSRDVDRREGSASPRRMLERP